MVQAALMLKALLDSGADVNAVGYGNMTPLCWAAHAGQEDAVRFLIEHGADVAYRVKDGTSPASEAIQERHYALGRILIDKGGKCSFHQAVQCNHVARARELLSARADVNEEDDSWAQSPIEMAMCLSHGEAPASAPEASPPHPREPPPGFLDTEEEAAA